MVRSRLKCISFVQQIKKTYFKNTFFKQIQCVKNTQEGERVMIDLYIDFDGVIQDTIKVSYKMMEEQGISLSDRANVIKFYQEIDWNKLIEVSGELNKAFVYINQICEEKKYRVSILTTVNSQQEMIAKVNYIRSKNKEIGIVFVPSGIDKSQIVKAQGAILVDDYSGNLLKWTEAGGIGIKFISEDSFTTISSLQVFTKNENSMILKRKRTT